MEVDENEDSWNYYNADVTVVREASYNGAGMYDPETRSTYNVQQSLNAGTWDLRMQTTGLDPTGDGSAAPTDVDAARVETDDAASHLRLYDRAGSSLATTPPPLASYAGQPLPPGGDTVPPFPTAPAGPSPHRAGGRPSSGPVLSVAAPPGASTTAASSSPIVASRRGREWLHQIVITPRSRQRHLARLESAFGRQTGRIGRLDRYVRQSGDYQTEHLFDPESGAVVEENLAHRGRLLLHVTRRYERFGVDRHVLRSARYEFSAENDVHRQAIEYRLDNIRVEARGAR